MTVEVIWTQAHVGNHLDAAYCGITAKPLGIVRE